MAARPHDSRDRSHFPRTARVNRVLREVIAERLERVAETDERLEMATVTAVDTAPDLRSATVYLSSLDDDMAAALAEERPRLQGAIGREVRLKRTPHLVFTADPAVASGEHVEQILRQLRRAAGPAGELDPGADAR